MPPTLLKPGSIPNNDEIPIQFIIKWIKKHMYELGYNHAKLNDRILIIQAKTGSGKSTVLPVEIFRILRNKDTPVNTPYFGKKVLCTQPRVLTAIELAKTVSVNNSPFNPDMVLGKTVGYTTKYFKERPRSGLIYATSGVLRKQLTVFTDDKIMNEYKFIIIDEAHERSVDADITLLMLYELYKRNENNKDLPFLILTSATFDTLKYAKYFNISEDNIINVGGDGFTIHKIWAKHDITNIYTGIIDILKKINKEDTDTTHKSDVLIFLPGMYEIKTTATYIENESSLHNTLVLKLDREAVNNATEDYINVFADHSKLPKVHNKIPTRRIILSTSIAETGLTINTLKYVIDVGLHRGVETYPIYNISGLVTRPSTQSRIIQRRGRVGRLFDGYYYPLYTESVFNKLDEQQLPDVLTLSRDYYNIHLSLYNIYPEFDISKVNLLDLPSHEAIIYANSVNTLLGFIDHDNKLTELGKIASKFVYINSSSARIIFAGFMYKVAILDLITICALQQEDYFRLFLTDNIFRKVVTTSYDKNIPCEAFSIKSMLPSFIKQLIENDDENADADAYFYKYKLLFCDDFIETLLVFESYMAIVQKLKYNVDSIKEWCNNNCLNFVTLSNIYENRENIMDELLDAGIDIFYNSQYKMINQNMETYMETIINIKQCLYDGLKHNLLMYDEQTLMYKTLQGLQLRINHSILSNRIQNKLKSIQVLASDVIPKYILTDRIFMSKKNSEEIMYTIETNYISILDGYIHPDLTIYEPK